MKRKKFEKLLVIDGLDYALMELSYEMNDIWNRSEMKSYVKQAIDQDDWLVAQHICESIMSEKDSNYYLWDCSMGCLDKPTPILTIEDVEHLLED